MQNYLFVREIAKNTSKKMHISFVFLLFHQSLKIMGDDPDDTN
jgi:hypothetical protein